MTWRKGIAAEDVMAQRTWPCVALLSPTFLLSSHMARLLSIRSCLAGAVLLFAASAPAQVLDSASATGLRWRNGGPANFIGRLSCVAGSPGPSKSIFVAASAGGIWKSTNNGITWKPTFDDKRIISMGMLAIAPSDTQQVWAGTGEPNSRNSI